MKKSINRKNVLIILLLLVTSFYAGVNLSQYYMKKEFESFKRDIITNIADKKTETKVYLESLNIEDGTCKDLSNEYIDRYFDSMIKFMALNNIVYAYNNMELIDEKNIGNRLVNFRCPPSIVIWLSTQKTQTRTTIKNTIKDYLEER
jgi:hypothetical protein